MDSEKFSHTKKYILKLSTMCVDQIFKFILHIFNVCILIAGFIVIGFSISLMDKLDGMHISKINLSSFALGIGIMLCFVAVLGCVSVSCVGNWWLLTIYSVVLIMIVITQIALAAIIFVNFSNSEQKLRDSTKSYLEDLYRKPEKSTGDKVTINLIHAEYKCCGIYGPSDKIVQLNNTLIITSCCPASLFGQCTLKNAYKKGCLEELTKSIKQFLNIIAIMALVFGAIELAAAILACFIKRMEKNS